MDGRIMETNFDTIPSSDRERSYDGDYQKAGKKAENIVLKWLHKNPLIIGVDDLRDLKIMQKADVDCAISTKDGRVALAEIKSDRHIGKSGNFLFEALRINHTSETDFSMALGWSARSPAKWLLYFAPFNNFVHKISFHDFRAAMQEYTDSYRKNSRINFVPTDNIKSTVNILIPDNYIVKKTSYTSHSLAAFTATGAA
jgi:hypothetical protein